MTSFRAEEHGQAVLEFTELIDRRTVIVASVGGAVEPKRRASP